MTSESDTDLIARHGPTIVATWPGRCYPVRRIALERAEGSVLLVVDGHVLKRFGLPDLASAFAAFTDLDPLPLATSYDVLAGLGLDERE